MIGAVSLADVFPTPTFEYLKLAPVLIVLGAAVIGVLVEAFVPRAARRGIQLVVVFASLIVSLIYVVLAAGTREAVAMGAVMLDGPGVLMQGLILVLAVIGGLVMAERTADPLGDAFAPRASALPGSDDERQFTERGYLQTEIWPLMLFSVGGMLLFPVSNDLLMMFVALEVMSLPLYLMAGMARRRRLLSQEAAMKYFILGAFSSAFFLYGSALLYGYAGTINLQGIGQALSGNPEQTTLVFLGVALLAVGLLFKVSAVPFHQWVPDVYQGAPTPLTGFMAAAVKVAAFGALLRIFYVCFGGLRWDWQPLMWGIAAITMLLGSIVAVTQTDIKRMLAYSSIAQAGFILIGVVSTNQQGIAASLFYLAAYGVATIGAFAIINLVRDASGEATHLAKWAGLGKKSPMMATAFSVFMLSFAGIPLTAGFIGKFAVFTAAVQAGAMPLVIVAVLASVIAAFFYIRVIVLMFFSDPAPDGPSVAVPSIFTTVAVAMSVTITVILGVIPQPLLDLASRAGVFVR